MCRTSWREQEVHRRVRDRPRAPELLREADTPGHAAGDQVLEHVALMLSQAVRGADTVTIGGSGLRLGMSVGQAETAVPADADSAAHKELATALLLAADQDIYRVKTEMRGAVCTG